MREQLCNCFGSSNLAAFSEEADKTNEILAVTDMIKERVDFMELMIAGTVVEKWIPEIEVQMVAGPYGSSKKEFLAHPEDSSNRTRWLFGPYASQALLLIDQIHWTRLAEVALDITKLQRVMMGAPVVMDEHGRIVLTDLHWTNVSNNGELEWSKQLLYYWIPEDEECGILIEDAVADDCACWQTSSAFSRFLAKVCIDSEEAPHVDPNSDGLATSRRYTATPPSGAKHLQCTAKKIGGDMHEMRKFISMKENEDCSTSFLVGFQDVSLIGASARDRAHMRRESTNPPRAANTYRVSRGGVFGFRVGPIRYQQAVAQSAAPEPGQAPGPSGSSRRSRSSSRRRSSLQPLAETTMRRSVGKSRASARHAWARGRRSARTRGRGAAPHRERTTGRHP